jgi:hypothetical protein
MIGVLGVGEGGGMRAQDRDEAFCNIRVRDRVFC